MSNEQLSRVPELGRSLSNEGIMTEGQMYFGMRGTPRGDVSPVGVDVLPTEAVQASAYASDKLKVMLGMAPSETYLKFMEDKNRRPTRQVGSVTVDTAAPRVRTVRDMYKEAQTYIGGVLGRKDLTAHPIRRDALNTKYEDDKTYKQSIVEGEGKVLVNVKDAAGRIVSKKLEDSNKTVTVKAVVNNLQNFDWLNRFAWSRVNAIEERSGTSLISDNSKYIDNQVMDVKVVNVDIESGVVPDDVLKSDDFVVQQQRMTRKSFKDVLADVQFQPEVMISGEKRKLSAVEFVSKWTDAKRVLRDAWLQDDGARTNKNKAQFIKDPVDAFTMGPEQLEGLGMMPGEDGVVGKMGDLVIEAVNLWAYMTEMKTKNGLGYLDVGDKKLPLKNLAGFKPSRDDIENVENVFKYWLQNVYVEELRNEYGVEYAQKFAGQKLKVTDEEAALAISMGRQLAQVWRIFETGDGVRDEADKKYFIRKNGVKLTKMETGELMEGKTGEYSSVMAGVVKPQMLIGTEMMKARDWKNPPYREINPARLEVTYADFIHNPDRMPRTFLRPFWEMYSLMDDGERHSLEYLLRSKWRGGEGKRLRHVDLRSFQDTSFPNDDFLNVGGWAIELSDKYLRGAKGAAATKDHILPENVYSLNDRMRKVFGNPRLLYLHRNVVGLFPDKTYEEVLGDAAALDELKKRQGDIVRYYERQYAFAVLAESNTPVVSETLRGGERNKFIAAMEEIGALGAVEADRMRIFTYADLDLSQIL